jgi:hypothetical protein
MKYGMSQVLLRIYFLVSKATAQCIKIEFEQDGCSIKNSVGEVLAGAIQENRLYKLLCSRVPKNVQIAEYLESVSVQVARKRSNLTIWHERFGHFGEQNLKLIIQKKSSHWIKSQT